jgi:hypothetical protein
MRKLSKSVDEFINSQGWSVNSFLEHAKFLFSDVELAEIATFEVGRSVIYIRNKKPRFNKDWGMMRVYVHLRGLSKDWMTILDANGYEIAKFHSSANAEEIKAAIVFRFKKDFLFSS